MVAGWRAGWLAGWLVGCRVSLWGLLFVDDVGRGDCVLAVFFGLGGKRKTVKASRQHRRRLISEFGRWCAHTPRGRV